MTNAEDSSEYTIVITKNNSQKIVTSNFEISLETLVSGIKGKIVINPIYEYAYQENKNIHLKRRREILAWELEAVMMLKVLPREMIIDKNILDDIKNKKLTEQVIKLFRNGILLEVPDKFAQSEL